MHCPRCSQPMHSRSWRHRDGHTDTRHVCRNHLCRYRWQSRCDATPAMVAEMRALDPWTESVRHNGERLAAAGFVWGKADDAVPPDTYHAVAVCDPLTATTSGLDELAKLYGLSRNPGEPDENLRERCNRKLSPYGALTVCTTACKVGEVREPEVLGHTTGGDLVLGVQRKPNAPQAGSDLVIAAQAARSEPPEDGQLYVHEPNCGPRWKVLDQDVDVRCACGSSTAFAHDGKFRVWNGGKQGNVCLGRRCLSCGWVFEWWYRATRVEEPKPAREGCGAPRGIIIHGHRGAPPGSTFVMPDYFEEQP